MRLPIISTREPHQAARASNLNRPNRPPRPATNSWPWLVALTSLLSLGPPQPRAAEEPFAAALAEAERTPSQFQTDRQRQAAVTLFTALVGIPSPSGAEGPLRNYLRGYLTALGAREIRLAKPEAPRMNNLVMEFPASPGLADQGAIMLNAHLDTISALRCTPEGMRYDASQGDFYHEGENQPGRSSSFGADDKVGVAVIVSALAVLQTGPLNRSVGGTDGRARSAAHRRILVVLTAEEETGFKGAKHLAQYYPELFAGVEVSLTFDGPLEFESNYPKDSLVVVVKEASAATQPYRHVLELVGKACGEMKVSCGRTETGLGMGDFEAFPAQAHAGLHLRSPQRGLHARERVKVADLIRHIDLLGYLLLNYDAKP